MKPASAAGPCLGLPFPLTGCVAVLLAACLSACAPGGGTSPQGQAGTGANTTGAAGTSAGGTTGGDPSGAAGTSAAGEAGTSGIAGTTGTAGSSATGMAGTNGVAGTTGTAGAPGSAGRGGGAGTSTGGRGGSSAVGTGGTASTVVEAKLVTSGQNAYWQTGTWTEVTAGTVDVTVNDATMSQTWDGFGGTFNEVGWSVLSMLSAGDRDRAMNLLFSAQDGARFVQGRVPIGASDYALSRYTLNDTANDATMANFSIARDRQNLIPYIKAALAINPNLFLWGSPWSPPYWMKDNNVSDMGNMRDDATVLQAHALYLAKFVEEYGKEGIKIAAIHPQNEPGYSTNYPSCLWTPALMTKYIRDYLGPLFASRNVPAQIYLGTMSNADAGKDGTIISTVVANAGALAFVKGFGLQWNMITSVAGLRARNLPIVQTEHKCGNYPWNPAGLPAFNPNQAPNDYPYGVESWGYIRDWVKAGVTSYSAWNMVLDSVGKNIDAVRVWPQNALLTVNTSAKTLTVTPAYYVFRHVSQYVDPGAKVVTTTGGDALAFKNPDGTLVAVVHNTGTAARNMIVAIGGKRLQFMVPANGFATVNPQ